MPFLSSHGRTGKILSRILAFAMPLALLAPPFSAAALHAVKLADGFSAPLYATSPAGDDRLFVVEQGGTIRILNSKTGAVRSTPFLTVRSIDSGGERGLLGLAFHPNYRRNGLFYVNLTNASGDTEIRRYQVSGDRNTADPESGEVLLTIRQPFSNHNGGWIGFGPDGFLYIACGDGGSGNDPDNRAQNTRDLLGKILRIDVDRSADGKPYAIPAGNPFAEGGGGAPEVWAYGLRNPWRCSFDRKTDDFYIADVGQNAREEINFQPAKNGGGRNYGWRPLEGTRSTLGISDSPPANAIAPIHEYDHTGAPRGGFSVTGGYVYRGSSEPALNGTYFFADFVTAQVWSFRYDGARKSGFRNRTSEITDAVGEIASPASFAEDSNGELLLISLDGAIYRLTKPGAGRPVVAIRKPEGRRITVSRARLRIRGTAAAANGLDRIVASVNRQTVRLPGKRSWSFEARLVPGKNRIRITAVDRSGNRSAPQVLAVTRR